MPIARSRCWFLEGAAILEIDKSGPGGRTPGSSTYWPHGSTSNVLVVGFRLAPSVSWANGGAAGSWPE